MQAQTEQVRQLYNKLSRLSENALKGKILLNADTEKALFDRFAKSKVQTPVELTYEFTKDRGMLQQYYQLRENMFISVWGLKHFSGQEDEFDKRSHVLVARKGNHVVGGSRITVKSPRARKDLPMEGPDFNLETLCPELSLTQVKYGEFSRLALLPDYRGGSYTQEIYNHLNRKSVALGLSYVFAIAPLAQARSYRRAYLSLGYDYSICEDVKVPDREEYEGIKMCLSVLDLTPFIKANETTPAQETEEA